MKRHTVDPTPLSEYDSAGVSIAEIAEGGSPFKLSYATFEAGGTIGPHLTGVAQVFCVVRGRGWVSGADGVRHPISTGELVFWEEGEIHASGSAQGMTALILQTDDPTIPVPEA